MNIINLNDLQLKTFTKQDVLDYCLLNDINIDNITELYLWNNELTDISGVGLFKNLEKLNLAYHKLTNISVIQNLNKLKLLNIRSLEIESDQIQYIQFLNNLKKLFCHNGFKDMSVLNKLNKKIKVYLF